jgi:hypothetical protein
VSRLRASLGIAQFLLERDGSLSNEYLALVLEASSNHALPAWLQQYLIRHLRGEVKRKKGRKAAPAAATDFTLVDARALYQQRLEHHQEQDRLRRRSVAKADRQSPQERALCDVLHEMKQDFPNITWQRLRNLISKNTRAPCPME